MIRTALLLALWAQPSQAALVHFCWAGSNGYTMTGSMEFPDGLLEADVVTQDEVTRFRIAGFRDGQLIGTWDLSEREPNDTWYLRYFPRTMQFPTNGEIFGPFDQGFARPQDDPLAHRVTPVLKSRVSHPLVVLRPPAGVP